MVLEVQPFEITDFDLGHPVKTTVMLIIHMTYVPLICTRADSKCSFSFYLFSETKSCVKYENHFES